MSFKSMPLISVSMLTYNQKKYIHQAIESVLEQKIKYQFEIVVGDDCSTDGTSEILLCYANKYPKLIKLITHKKNIGIVKNSLSLKPFYCGKYIAPLDGDDYFIDPYKLQEQAEFLEANPQFAGIAGQIKVVDDRDNFLGKKELEIILKNYCKGSCYTKKDVEHYRMSGIPGTMMYKRLISLLDEQLLNLYDASPAMADRKMNLVLAFKGGVYCSNKEVTAYRVYDSSFSTRRRKYCSSFYAFYEMEELQCLAKELFGEEIDYGQAKMKAWYGTFISALRHPNKRNIQAARMIYRYDINQREKIIFLLSHTLGWPIRKIRGLY